MIRLEAFVLELVGAQGNKIEGDDGGVLPPMPRPNRPSRSDP